MKSLVIYDSAFGNTKKIAERIAEVLDAKVILVRDFQKADLLGVELLVVGSPINAWRPLPSISSFLNSFKDNELTGIKATTFDTRVKLFIHGDAKDKMAKDIKAAGAEIIAEPEAFYVKGSEGPLFEGELERAGDWAKSISKQNN